MATYSKLYALNAPGIRVATDADFRDKGKFISDSLEAGGFIKTSDTGQINWATVLKPTAGTGVMMGYEIRRTNDAFSNYYVKIEYGGGYNANCLGFSVTFSTATDGAGGLTGLVSPRVQSLSAVGFDGTVAGRILVCVTASHFSFFIVEDATTNKDRAALVMFQRKTDSSGVDVDGEAMVGAVSYYLNNQMVIAKTATEVNTMAFLRAVRIKGNASNVPVFPIYVHGESEFWPMRDLIVLPTQYATWLGSQSVTILGSSRSYTNFFSSTTSTRFGYNTPEAFTYAMRYE